MWSNTESCTHRISGCFVQYDRYFCSRSMSVVVAVYVLRELVSRPTVTAQARPRAQPYIAPRLTRGRPTPNGNLVAAELHRWMSSRRFCSPLRFVVVYPVRRRRRRRSAASPMYAFLSGSVDCHWIIPWRRWPYNFLSTLSIDVRFSLIHFSHVTSSHNGWLRHSYFVSW